jgi:hypothetical protein
MISDRITLMWWTGRAITLYGVRNERLCGVNLQPYLIGQNMPKMTGMLPLRYATRYSAYTGTVSQQTSEASSPKSDWRVFHVISYAKLSHLYFLYPMDSINQFLLSPVSDDIRTAPGEPEERQ